MSTDKFSKLSSIHFLKELVERVLEKTTGFQFLDCVVISTDKIYVDHSWDVKCLITCNYLAHLNS